MQHYIICFLYVVLSIRVLLSVVNINIIVFLIFRILFIETPTIPTYLKQIVIIIIKIIQLK